MFVAKVGDETVVRRATDRLDEIASLLVAVRAIRTVRRSRNPNCPLAMSRSMRRRADADPSGLLLSSARFNNARTSASTPISIQPSLSPSIMSRRHETHSTGMAAESRKTYIHASKQHPFSRGFCASKKRSPWSILVLCVRERCRVLPELFLLRSTRESHSDSGNE